MVSLAPASRLDAHKQPLICTFTHFENNGMPRLVGLCSIARVHRDCGQGALKCA
jgi:hypothetical protein